MKYFGWMNTKSVGKMKVNTSIFLFIILYRIHQIKDTHGYSV